MLLDYRVMGKIETWGNGMQLALQAIEKGLDLNLRKSGIH